jgi:hypothetical protein
LKPQEKWLAGLLAAGLAAAIWLAFQADSSQEGGQFRQLGESLGNRSGRVTTSDYAFVANSRTRQYWPNQPRYVNAIPANDRVWILDQETLRDFKGYRPGPR